MPSATDANWRDIVQRHLEPLLGAFTAQVAVKTATLRVHKRPPEQVTLEELPAVLEALKPILTTFVGALHTNVMLEHIKTDLEKTR